MRPLVSLDQIAAEFGEPWEDVVSGFGAMGYSRRSTAAALGIPRQRFAALLQRNGLNKFFPATGISQRRECRGGVVTGSTWSPDRRAAAKPSKGRPWRGGVIVVPQKFCGWCGAEITRKKWKNGMNEPLQRYLSREACNNKHSALLRESRRSPAAVRPETLKISGNNDIVRAPVPEPVAPPGFSDRMLRGALR